MLNIKKRKSKQFYKKFIRLRVNPLNNHKITKFKKEKWKNTLNLLEKNNKFYTKFKPYANYDYSVSKFASPGNSFKRKFRNNLFAKKTFNYMYGNLVKKYLKKHMTKIYNSKQLRNSILTSIEYFESRLDSLLYRSKFCYSIQNARQLITHQHIKVNNKIERNRSYILKQGDLIQITSNSEHIIKNNLKKQFNDMNKLDLVLYLYRTKPHYTIKTIQNIIDNGHISINNKVVKNRSYILKPKDKIQINSQYNKIIKNNNNIIKRYKPDGLVELVDTSDLKSDSNNLEYRFKSGNE
jgi:small subunit ribosomal protein S4